MDVFVSAGLMACVLVLLLSFLYKVFKLCGKHYLIHSQSLELLRQSHEMESLPTKQQRLHAMVEWKQKRDSVLFNAESLEREFSEAED